MSAAEEDFREAQQALLERFGSQARSRHAWLAEPNLRIHFLEAGRGEHVVLLHRSGGAAVGWLPLLSALEAHFHVIAVDAPGCGLTDKVNFRGVPFRKYASVFLRSLLDTLDISRAAIVGNSVGAYYGLVLALARPERVTKLALVGAPAGVEPSLPRFLRLLGVRGLNRLLHAAVLSPSLEGTRELFRYLLVANVARVPVEYLHCSYLSRVIPGNERCWLALLEELVTIRGFRKEYLITEELGRIQQPVLLLWGEEDWFAPPSAGERICRRLPNARLEVAPNAGHLPWLDRPEWTAEMLIPFLQ